MDLRLSITCPSCCASFRAPRQSIRDGATLRCPHCGNSVCIDSHSESVAIRRVLSVARRIGVLVTRLRPDQPAEAAVRRRGESRHQRRMLRIKKERRSGS